MKLCSSWTWVEAAELLLPLTPVAELAAVAPGTIFCSVEVMSCSKLPLVALEVLPESVLAKLLGLLPPEVPEYRPDREFWLASCCSQLVSLETFEVITVFDS
jgi:hypothetical protein